MEKDLRNLICERAIRLIEVLDHCDDGDFVDVIVNAVENADSLSLWDYMEDGDGM